MITFLVVHNLGWAKGKTLTEAFANFKQYNSKAIRGKYQLTIFDCLNEKDYEEIYANEFQYFFPKTAKKVYHEVESR